jgi:UTP--glucose-1-phosphate uridylyltransferase
MTVRKAVFPVAGLGTRFLPATKAVPKELLPVVDKPLIQYASEEALRAGVDELIFVTSPAKNAIQEHFAPAGELEALLRRQGKDALSELLRSVLPAGVNCRFVIQHEPRGLGHAVLCAREAVGDEPFAVILPDDLIDDAAHGCLAQMVEVYSSRRTSVLAVEHVQPHETDRYGIVSANELTDHGAVIRSIVEKPQPAVAPSTLAVVGRYIFTPRLFEFLERTAPGSGGEIQLTDAIAMLAAVEEVYAYRFRGVRFDCGSKLGMLRATVNFGLKDPEIGGELAAHIDRMAADYRRGGL